MQFLKKKHFNNTYDEKLFRIKCLNYVIVVHSRHLVDIGVW